MHTLRYLFIASLLGFLAQSGAHADSTHPTLDTPSRLSLMGFATLGLTRTDVDEVQYVRDLSQPNGADTTWTAKIDSVVGLQAAYRLGEASEAVVQLQARHGYDGGHDPEVTWAYLRHDPNPDLSLRLGRLGTEFFMRADSRWVGYANLSVRPPPDFYDSLVITYLDGFDATATMQIGDDLVRGKFYAGYAREKTPFIPPYTWNFDDSLLFGGHLDYVTGPWQVRFGHARLRFENELPFDAFVREAYGLDGFLDAVPELRVAGTWATYTSLGAVYESGPLQVQAMLNRIGHESSAYEDSRAAYVIAGYRTGDVTPYIGHSRIRSRAASFGGDPASPYTQLGVGLARQTHSDQETTFLGLRWDIRENMALKLQFDHIDARPDSLFPYREGYLPTWKGRMHVYSLALECVF